MYIVKNYNFVGYDEFFIKIMPEIIELITPHGISEDAVDEFVGSFTEAVCNAAQYSVDGMDSAKIFINLILTNEQLKITVGSVTTSFDANSLRSSLKKLAVSEAGNLDWQQYVGTSQQGRGIWLMLSYFDAVCIGSDGNEITLISRLPLRCTEVNTIKKIVHKFFVVENGVIT
ncbi:hypothetical protein NZ47_02830 [Anaerovibrio lipolyticus]|uniref:Histidine kinase/HSP90-like ATPase domain-containing protein n=1 Tax=Anaerovibrio lipolyticus TaxID=82374 RepID=A0A0B2K3Z2_9FIRM|nr:ATP-binding protein [Anaerovibrio lipolyticus]KHM52787.1 hypothetical protein NZ47_02830 [Anaerovibrio lipolyticus]